MNTVADNDTGITVAGNELKAGIMAKRHTLGSNQRKKLADISNLPQQPKLTIQDAKPQQNTTLTTKEYTDKLQKENASLKKILADRNKIIELSGVELQKMKSNLQKVQQQNLQLAQSNSQMLAELNTGKDKLKTLHHELGCKNGLIKSMNFVRQEKVRGACQVSVNEVGSIMTDEVCESLPEDREDDKTCKTNRRRKCQSLGPSTAKPIRSKEIVDNKRRRQSACFKPEEPEQAENLFEIEDAKFHVSPLHEELTHDNNNPKLLTSFVKIEHEKPDNNISGEKPEGPGRMSLGRPSRRAADKVQSYKEIPLNVKMRRAA